MIYLDAAYAGRIDMLTAIFGSGEKSKEDAKPAPPPLTPQAFDAVFGAAEVLEAPRVEEVKR